MGKFLRSVSMWLLMVINLVVSLLFVLCSAAPYINPERFWWTGFLGLSFPYLFFIMAALVLIFLLVRPKWAILPIVLLLLGSKTILLHFPLRLYNPFSIEKSSSSLRIMSWNLRHFIPFEEKYFKPDRLTQQQKVLSQIKTYRPDVICFQEFTSMPGEGFHDPMLVMREQLGYSYAQFAGADIFDTKQYSGIAIFSKFPILRGGVIPFPGSAQDNAESTVYADLLIKKDTVRIYAVHLQSFGFGSREYKAIDEVKKERELSVPDSKLLLRKMRNTFYWHGIQSDFIREQVASSPYKSIVAGDLNDVPGSYAYTRVRGAHKDAFLEKGAGLGSTFTSSSSLLLQLLPTLRIDYIFHPASFRTIQFTTGGKKISDHSFLVADLQ